jgi:hypothetical protein
MDRVAALVEDSPDRRTGDRMVGEALVEVGPIRRVEIVKDGTDDAARIRARARRSDVVA